MYLRGFILAISFFSLQARSAEVLQVGSSQSIIAVSHEPNKKWAMNEYACVYQGAQELGCGLIVKVTDKLGILKLAKASNNIVRGNKVYLATANRPTPKPVEERKPAAAELMQSVERDKDAKIYYHNLSGGFSVGNGFYYPLLHFQRLVSPSIAIGVMPTYFSVSTSTASSLTALGVMGTVNYYGNDFYQGLWLQGGLGSNFYSSQLTSGAEEQATSISALATVGWRGYWDLGFNIGACVGFQYLRDPAFAGLTLSGSGIQPMALIDLGFNF